MGRGYLCTGARFWGGVLIASGVLVLLFWVPCWMWAALFGLVLILLGAIVWHCA